MVTRRRFIGGLAASLGAATLTSPWGARPASATVAPPRLLVVGDSLTGSLPRRNQLRDQLRRSDLWGSITVDGRNGRKIEAAVPLVAAHKAEAVAAGEPAVYVIALGTNDLSHTWLTRTSDRAEIAARIDRVIAAAGDSLVVWVNTSFSRRKPGYPARARRFNTLLAEAAGRTANLRIIDWYTAHPPASPLFTPDGIHLTNRGFLNRVRLMARLTDEYFRAWTPPPV